MRLFIGCVLLLLALKSVDAATYTTQITSVDRGEADEVPMIFLSNGKVARLSVEDTNLFEDLDVALEQHSWVRVILNDKTMIVALESIKCDWRREKHSLYSLSDSESRAGEDGLQANESQL